MVRSAACARCTCRFPSRRHSRMSPCRRNDRHSSWRGRCAIDRKWGRRSFKEDTSADEGPRCYVSSLNDLRPHFYRRPAVAIRTYGTMAVDWERRIDFDRLRRERLARVKKLLQESSLGSVLCFDMNNVRYITATHIGTWAQDKISRFTLLPQNDEPILWDFGSAAKHHRIYCDWMGERSRAGIPLMRGAMTPEMGRSEDVARKIKIELEMRGLHKEPVGVDVVEPPVLFALQREGINVV